MWWVLLRAAGPTLSVGDVPGGRRPSVLPQPFVPDVLTGIPRTWWGMSLPGPFVPSKIPPKVPRSVRCVLGGGRTYRDPTEGPTVLVPVGVCSTGGTVPRVEPKEMRDGSQA